MGEYLCQKTKVFLGGKQSFVGLSNVSLEFVINTNLSGFLFFNTLEKLKCKTLYGCVCEQKEKQSEIQDIFCNIHLINLILYEL